MIKALELRRTNGPSVRLLGGLVIIFLLLIPHPGPLLAEAWEIKTGLGPVFGSEFSDQRKDGLGGQAYFDIGLSEFFSLSFGAGYCRHFMGSGQGYHLFNGGAGMTANLDVLVVVPFLTVRLGYMNLALDDDGSKSGLGISAAVGADYLWTEYFTIGMAFEYHGMLSDFDSFPSYLALTLRMGYRWLD